jgi:class 3 adenylate cyclase
VSFNGKLSGKISGGRDFTNDSKSGLISPRAWENSLSSWWEQENPVSRGSGQLKTNGTNTESKASILFPHRNSCFGRVTPMRKVVPVDDRIGNLPSLEVDTISLKSKHKLKRTESVVDLHLVSSFCPSLLLGFLAKKKVISLDYQFLSGASLIADISGFVKLCGDLSKCGAEGFDDLQICTRTFIGDLVKIVYHYGGDGKRFCFLSCLDYLVVISFAGDAIICCFPGNSPESCCRKAVACAFEMKDLRSLNLIAHIGVSYGEICFATLGGYEDQWVCLMSGEPMNEIAFCVNDAKPGEAVITPSCYQHVCSTNHSDQGDIVAELIPSGNYKLLAVTNRDMSKKSSSRPHIALQLDKILGFIPPSVRASIAAGSFNALSELREVTTLFLKLDTYSHIAHKDLRELQPFFFGMQEILGQCGGFLRQFLVDDKGCVLIAVWGVPKASYPNNCSRAISCAVRARFHAAEIGHTCSIGITTGHAYCGTVGSLMRQDYVAMGDAVNLAARLMGKAQGRILVDDNTFLRLPTAVSQYLQLAESLQLKGRVEVLQPYFYHSQSLPILPSYDDVDDRTITIDKSIAQTLVAELERLSDYQIQTVGIITLGICQTVESTDSESKSQPEPRIILVEGLPGSGKSTVADFFQKGSHRRNFRCIFLKLTSDTKVMSYGMIRKLFIELVGPTQFSTERKQRQIILTLLRQNFPGREIDAVLREHFPILRHALGLSWDFNTPTNSKKTIRESTFYGDPTLQHILHSLLRVCCTTLIIEDAHFCDELSMKELTLLLNVNMPLLILSTFRLQAEHVMLHMQKRPSFRNRALLTGNETPSKSPSEPPGRLKDSHSLRGHFYPTDSPDRPSLPRNGLGPRSNSQRRMSVPICASQMGTDEESSTIDLRRRFTVTETPSSFRGLYTNSASNSHSQGIQSENIAKRKHSVLSTGLRAKETNIRNLLEKRKYCTTLQLPNLNDEQVREILASYLTEVEVSREFAELVSEVTGGNPYWVNSIAKFARASGIQEFRTSLQTSDLHQADSPTKLSAGVRRLEHHIVCHLERFSVNQQTVCKFASIIGDEFQLEVLLRILPPKLQDKEKLAKSLQSLSEEGIVVLISEDPVAYSFQNELIRKTLSDFVLPRFDFLFHSLSLRIFLAKQLVSMPISGLLLRTLSPQIYEPIIPGTMSANFDTSDLP